MRPCRLLPILLATLALAGASFAGSAPPNVLFTSREGDPAGRNEIQPAMASLPSGRTLAAWVEATSGTSGSLRVHAAASFDSGATFVPLGQPPAPSTFYWRIEPALAADPGRDRVWLCGTVTDGVSTAGVAVVDAALAGGSVTWGTPRLVTTFASTTVAFPTVAFAVDSASGALHVLHIPFAASGPTTNFHVFHYRSLDGGLSWSAAAQLSETADAGEVSAPAIASGSPGVLQAAWVAPTPAGGSRVMTRRSTDNGANWGTASEVDSIAVGVAFRVGQSGSVFAAQFSMAMGPYGKYADLAYFAWSEPLSGHLSTFPDPTAQPSKVEAEPNDSSLAATPSAIGHVWRGGFASAGDVDTWSFGATTGQDFFFTADSGNAGGMQLMILAPDGVRRLANISLTAGSGSRALWSAPAGGTYYLRLRPLGTPPGGNAYRVRSMVAVQPFGRSRDASDLRLVRTSSGGAPFNRTTLGITAEGRFDAAPAVHFDPQGRPALSWFGTSSGALAAATDLLLVPNLMSFGAGSVVTLTDTTTDWSVPNGGGLQRPSLHRNESWLRFGFTDARRGDTDLFTTGLDCRVEFAASAPVAQGVAPGQAGAIAMPIANRSLLVPAPVTARVSAARDWGTVVPVEVTVPAASESPAMLAFAVPESAAAGPQVWVIELLGETGAVLDTHTTVLDVEPALLGVAPTAPAELALAPLAPQPVRGPAALRFRLPAAGHATLEVFGVRGERVRTLHSGPLGAGEHGATWDLRDGSGRAVPGGLYFVRLRAGQGTRVVRAMLVR